MMRRILEYGALFLGLILLQVFLFDNLNISLYFYPLIYVGFILVLPMNINPALLLVLSMLTGITVDFLSGTYGLHTIAMLAAGFVRPVALNVTVGKDASRDGGIPLPLTVGRGKWFRYALLLVAVHCFVFFFFEAMTLHCILFTIARAACSTVVTTVLLWFLASLFPSGNRRAGSF